MATERNWHKVKKSDRKRIRCSGKHPGGCGRPAWFCEHAAARGIPS